MGPIESRSPICLVFATQIEAEPAMLYLRSKPVYYYSSLFSGRLPGSEQRILIFLTGMGPKIAYLAMRALLMEQPISKVVNLGVAGSLRPHLQAGELGAIDCAHMENVSEEEFQGLDQIALCPLPNLPQRRLISVHTPVFNDERRTRLAAGADLVDMEGAAIAWACHQQHIPCRILKGVTDFAGADGRKMLHENLSEVSHALTVELFQRGDIFAS